MIAALVLAGVAVFKYRREASATHPPTTQRSRLRSAPPRPDPPRTAYPRAADDAAGSLGREPDMPSRPTAWSLPLLQSIEWKRFEEVVAAYFRAKNFRCDTVAHGPDGGVDGRLYFGDLPAPVGIVQCKAWGNRPVGVAPVRELRGVMAHEKVDRGYFCATGDFSPEAIAFAASNPIRLITGPDLLDAIAQMPVAAQRDLLALCTTGDYTTPTCASCGIKLFERTIGGKAAWGCRNYPRCKTKIFRRSEPPARSI